MNADTPSIGAPHVAPILLKKLGGAIVAAIDSTAFAVISLIVAALTYLVFLGFGNGAHGKWPDGVFVFVVWLVLLVACFGVLSDRNYSWNSLRRRFDSESLHRAALWLVRLKASRRWHLFCWPLLLALFWSSTSMQYSAPGTGITTGSGEYVIRVDGVTLSVDTPSIRALPWNYEFVPLRWKTHLASTRAASLDGTKFNVSVTADLALGDDPNLWPWQQPGLLAQYPKIDEALVTAAKAAVGKTPGREIDRGTFALEIDTAAALSLAKAGVRPDGEISISLKPYFDGSEAKVEAEKK